MFGLFAWDGHCGMGLDGREGRRPRSNGMGAPRLLVKPLNSFRYAHRVHGDSMCVLSGPDVVWIGLMVCSNELVI